MFLILILMSDKRENIILLEKILDDMKKISHDIFMIKNEIKCIRDINIPTKVVIPPIIEEDEITGWRLW
tara:strand:- start:265 stop:471 length:207 start_codon:yes stop_codon:yes gene_type:complete